ncbi:repressor LexA [Candidatus Sumerlaeota bacterium]|nr:repressor LexA [Candidatus Sumerlaeota bacterium]
MDLTERQREVLRFIECALRETGEAPSLQEIAQAFGMSSLSSARKHLQALERKGAIKRDWMRGRGIELTPGASSDQVARMPVLGVVAAGGPLELVESGETIGLPPELVEGAGTQVLRVSGDSMAGDAIRDGDYIIVNARRKPAEGDTVVARILPDNTYTVKSWHPSGKQIELRPANPAHEALMLAPDRVDVQGVVIGLLRKYE